MLSNKSKLYKGLQVGLMTMALGVGAISQAWAQTPQEIAAAVLANIHKATTIDEGKSSHVAYVFFDPNCPYCHKLYEETRSYVKSGELRLRWIPVGILTATSHGKAVAMLGAEDPLQAFYKNENHYSMGDGGIDEDLSSPQIEEKLKANEALLTQTQRGAVPLMLFTTKNGAAVMIQGAPPKDKLKTILSYLK